MASRHSITRREFDLQRLLDTFLACTKEDGTIALEPYVDVYLELCRFFHMLGTVFGFVSSDVKEKMDILRRYLNSDKADHYVTIQAMTTYEVTNKLTKSKNKNGDPSGTRTLLRLHRALEFVILFLQKILASEECYADKVSLMAYDAYHDSLANYHNWLIRKTAGVAFHMLPTRKGMIEQMCHQREFDKSLKLLSLTVEAAQPVYDIVQKLYVEHGIQDLP